MPRIHILGASGSGTTTLGAALAARLSLPHHDSDDIFWMPTDPPFTTRRAIAAKHALLRARLPESGDWVFSGSSLKWAAPLHPFYTLIVFLRLEPGLRMARLRRRETLRYGGRIAPGGDMAEASGGFLDWARSYDAAGLERRSLAAHEAWLAEQKAPVLRLDSAAPAEALAAAVEKLA